MNSSTSLALLGLLSALPAQVHSLVVPAKCTTTDGASLGAVAGITKRARQQVLVDTSHLVLARASTWDALWFRRDANGASTLSAGLANLAITISETVRVPAQASPAFDQNHGASRVTVFSGQVQVPASPPQITDPWAVDQSLRIPFGTPFLYAAGNVCIEIVALGAGFASSEWPIDCTFEDVAGTTASLGQHCSAAPGLPPGESLFANPLQLVLGASAVFTALGRVDTPAILLLGFELGGSGLDLSGAGMTGCTLWLQPVGALASVHAGQPATTPRWEFAAAKFTLPVPFQFSLLAGTFTTQAVTLETGANQSNPLGITLSQGLRCTLAAQPPSLGMAMVETPPVDAPLALPAEGVVVTNRAPVFRVLYH